MNWTSISEMFPGLDQYVQGHPDQFWAFTIVFFGSIIAVVIAGWLIEIKEEREKQQLLESLKVKSIWDSNIWYDTGMSSELK